MKHFIKRPRINKALIVFVLFFFSGADLIQAQTRAQKLRKLYLENNRSDALNKDRVWIMAHRGVWDEQAPESSVAAFKNAVDLKFEIIELDVSFSAEYTYENHQCIPVLNSDGKTKRDTKGAEIHRAIIFTHDPNSGRRRKDNVVDFGLYKYSGSVTNPPKKDGEFPGFVMLQNLVPYNHSNKEVIMEQNIFNGHAIYETAPRLLTLDGKSTDHKLITYNPASPFYYNFFGQLTYEDPFNYEMLRFIKTVKDKILINIDKLKKPRDFQAVYTLMKDAGLLEQCIFKAKEIKSLEGVYDLFGDKLKAGDQILFTPTFTEFDPDKGHECANEDERYNIMKTRWDAIKTDDIKNHRRTLEDISDDILPHKMPLNPTVTYDESEYLKKRKFDYQKTPIAIAGAEVIFTKDYSLQNQNRLNYFLTRLAADIMIGGKRIVQFGALPESKKGAWTGGQARWVGEGKYSKNNFWEFIYDNTNLTSNGTTIFSDVYVGDKPIEFRAYMSVLGYNMKPID